MTDSQIERGRPQVVRYVHTLDELIATAQETRCATPTLESLQRTRASAHMAIHVAHRLASGFPWNSRVGLAANRSLDVAALRLYEGKWLLGRADGTYQDFVEPSDEIELVAIRDHFLGAMDIAGAVADACLRGLTPPPLADSPRLERDDTEILFAGAARVPIVPSICPIVVLAGSNRAMGRQYAKQVIDIYGTWCFERLAARTVTAEEAACVERWQAELERAAPEVVEFAIGCSEGASEAGVELSRVQAIAIWTGYRPPADGRHLMFGEDLDPVAGQEQRSDGVIAYSGGAVASDAAATDRCSGACAWGEATTDGQLVAGCTTDHECTYQATIVAFPEAGNHFIYTPFSVNGSTPVLGRQFMAGHPGLNDKGLAYVHHGGHSFEGGACGGGPPEQWGYGVRRGAATLHALQFAGSAKEAKEMMLALPVGDPGPILGTAGGMFADPHAGYVIEERTGAPNATHPIVRSATYDRHDRPHRFLYANNNPLDPDPGVWRSPREANFRYSRDAGWHIVRAEDAGSTDPVTVAGRMATKNSAARNRYLYGRLMEVDGRIDLDAMRGIYGRSGTVPDGPWEEAVERWRAGEEWEVSTVHRANAFTALIERPADDAGSYHGCIGPARRSIEVREPSHGYYYYDETNAFWTLRLQATPVRLMDAAAAEAERRIAQAARLSEQLTAEDAGRSLVTSLLDQAHEAMREGRDRGVPPSEDSRGIDDDTMAAVAYRTRAFTRAQVRAAQVADLLEPTGAGSPAATNERRGDDGI